MRPWRATATTRGILFRMTQVLDLKSLPPRSRPGVSTGDVTPVEAVVVAPTQPQLPPSSELVLPSILDHLLPPPDISWRAEHKKTARQWQRHYLAMSAFALVGMGVALWQSSGLSALVVLLGLAAWEARERFQIGTDVVIHERGVSVDDQLIAHADLASFDVYPLPDGTHELSLLTHSIYPGHVQISLGDQDPEEVKSTMAHYVLPAEHAPHFMSWWLRG